jgi:tetratricopeptide repeat protein 21B
MQVAHTLAKLIEQIDESEPHGYKIYLSSARTFLRLCGSHHLVLRQCLTLLERSYSVKNSIEAITEQAYLNIILGNFSHALSIYKNCLSVDQGNIPALLGMVHCMLKINRTKEATQQLEFLNELQASSKTAYLLFLNALAVETVSDESDFIDCLISALELQFALVKNIPVSMEYYMNLNPDLIVSICEIILSVLQSKPSTTVGQSSNSLQQVLSSLRCLVKSAPGLLHVQLLLARFLFVKGDTVAALSLIQLCIDEGYSVIEALMLQAVIFFHLGDNQHCGQILETALSQSFEIQQCPLFLLIQGQQFYVSGLYKDCITSIQTALSLKNMKSL